MQTLRNTRVCTFLFHPYMGCSQNTVRSPNTVQVLEFRDSENTYVRALFRLCDRHVVPLFKRIKLLSGQKYSHGVSESFRIWIFKARWVQGQEKTSRVSRHDSYRDEQSGRKSYKEILKLKMKCISGAHLFRTGYGLTSSQAESLSLGWAKLAHIRNFVKKRFR